MIPIIIRGKTEQTGGESERLASLHFFESMDRVNRVIQEAQDLEQTMNNILDELLSIFECDRASLVYPCDPNAPTWHVVIERARLNFQGPLVQGSEYASTPDAIEVFKMLRAKDGSLTIGPGKESDVRLSEELSKFHRIQSLLAMAIYPKVDRPYVFGIHQCSYPRVWSDDEKGLFEAIGKRVSDGLTSLLILRNLRQSEEKYRLIVETSAEGIWSIAPDGKTTFVNAKMAEMLGYLPEELIGRSISEFVFKEDLPDHLQKIGARPQVRTETYECRFRRKDRRAIWTSISASAVYDEYNRFTGSFAMIADITERKRTEEAIRTSERRLADVISLLPDSTFAIDVNGVITTWNRAAEELTGVKAKDIIGKGNQEYAFVLYGYRRPALVDFVLHPSEEGKKLYPSLRQEGATLSSEDYFKSVTRGEIYVSLIAAPLYDSEGKISGAIETIHDLTERKRAEDALRESEESFRSLVDQSPLSIHILNPDGRTVRINKSYEVLWGLSLEDLRDYNILYDPQIERLGLNPLLRKAFSGERIALAAIEYDPNETIGKGIKRWISLVCHTVKDKHGNIRNVVMIYEDITPRKQAERALLQAKEDAERTARLKAHFLDTAAHELRTPVTAFSVLLDLALKRQKSGEPPVSDLLYRLQRQAKRLSRLIIDLLDVSRLDRGMITLREICADIVSVISATVDEFIMQFPKRRFQFHRPPRAIEIDLDPARISQVLSNLLDNAVKYTPEDIPVEIHIDSRTDWVRVSVVDHGPGIAKDQQANLFSPFTRGTTDREERAGGLGLGLAVCRGLIELHGGTMGVMSEPGVGSTFYFELPRVICSRKDK